jgi:hypothetical protein
VLRAVAEIKIHSLDDLDALDILLDTINEGFKKRTDMSIMDGAVILRPMNTSQPRLLFAGE